MKRCKMIIDDASDVFLNRRFKHLPVQMLPICLDRKFLHVLADCSGFFILFYFISPSALKLIGDSVVTTKRVVTQPAPMAAK